MKRLFTVLGFLYVSYAILTAYTALDRLQAHDEVDIPVWANAQEVRPTARDWQPMDFIDTPTYANVKDEYWIEVWVGPRCHWCRKWKDKELPKLEKRGVKVKIKDGSKEKRPKDLRVYPMIKVYRLKKCIRTFHGYTKAEDILKHVKTRVVLLR